MTAARNVAIIALLALGVAFLPNGGNVADAVLTGITLGFLGAIAWVVSRLALARQLTLMTLPDSRRAVLYAGVGLIVLMVAGAGNMLATGLGTLAWLALLASGAVAIWLVMSEARDY